MIGPLWRWALGAYARRYATDVGYLEFMRAHDGAAFRRLLLIAPASAHRGRVPVRAVFAARMVAVLSEDCGPCVAIVVRMAGEAGMDARDIRSVLQRDKVAMDLELRAAAGFAEALVARSPDLDDARERVMALSGARVALSPCPWRSRRRACSPS